MWPRAIELMLACWLAISPYIFRHDSTQISLWVTDYVAAFVVGAAALLSFHRRMHRAHLATLCVAATLIVRAYMVEQDPPPPAYQNSMAVGVLLCMFAIIPSHCDRMPRAWREFLGDTADD